ncbi:hypothetical protein CXB51_005690 [Gossypium anomalum]|uniref:Translation initiation factor 5A C-terminal domain-containing protein n=17 Tax=Gossypium TaxID=3633 RepID=A0A8J6D520_9ROSI|nr:hypothetical protein CXB51_005690 [Gossypium anomalum]
MSDEEHHFESKADAGASKTYPQQAGTIRKNGYIVIKGRPCKVVEVSTSKTGKHGHAKCHFVGIDIFTGKKLEDILPSSHNCDVPHVNRTDYQLIDISEDGFVSLLTENGNTKDDLRLPTDDNLLTQIKDGFAEGKDLVVSVMSAMGEEQICGLKDIGPKKRTLPLSTAEAKNTSIGGPTKYPRASKDISIVKLALERALQQWLQRETLNQAPPNSCLALSWWRTQQSPHSTKKATRLTRVRLLVQVLIFWVPPNTMGSWIRTRVLANMSKRLRLTCINTRPVTSHHHHPDSHGTGAAAKDSETAAAGGGGVGDYMKMAQVPGFLLTMVGDWKLV